MTDIAKFQARKIKRESNHINETYLLHADLWYISSVTNDSCALIKMCSLGWCGFQCNISNLVWVC